MLPQLRTNSSDTGKAGPELRVVAIGGGTGLSTLLKGLKGYVMTPSLATPGQPTIRELSGVVTASNGKIRELVLVPADVEPLPQTQEAIASADLITIGPGSLFTSLIPNLLVRGIPEAILASPAIKVFVCNLMTQANESLSLTAA